MKGGGAMGPWENGAFCGGWPMGGLFMMIMMVLFWGAIIVGGVYLLRWVMRGGHSGAPAAADTALETLRLRYAKGEISKEEFEQMKKDLQ